MLGTGAVVVHRARLLQRELERLGCLPGERDLAAGHRAGRRTDALAHPRADELVADAQRREHEGCDAVRLAHQAEQQVLAADRAVPEREGLLMRPHDHRRGRL